MPDFSSSVIRKPKRRYIYTTSRVSQVPREAPGDGIVSKNYIYESCAIKQVNAFLLVMCVASRSSCSLPSPGHVLCGSLAIALYTHGQLESFL